VSSDCPSSARKNVLFFEKERGRDVCVPATGRLLRPTRGKL
jgi:hypothetical protein